MKKLFIILLLIFCNVSVAQYPYTDIGNTRLMDSAGVFVIKAKPNRTMGSMRIFKTTNFEDSASFSTSIADAYLDPAIYTTSKIDTSHIIFDNRSLAHTIIAALTFSAAATFNSVLTAASNFIVNGFSTIGDEGIPIKSKLIAMKLPSADWGSVTKVHGIADYKNIISFTITTRDSAGRVYYLPNYSYSANNSFQGYVDSTKCVAYPGNNANIKSDSVFFLIFYRGVY